LPVAANFRDWKIVYYSVDPSTIASSSRLWTDYRAAFKDWASQVKRLKWLTTSAANRVVVKEAEDQVKTAELVYRDTRNRLSDEINHHDEERPFADHDGSPQ